MISLLDRQVVFFGGKGGVGKTTCSSAFALAASRRGQRVLLVSTDPAHSTSDIFERKIGPDEREIEPRLWAIEIDARRESARYVAEVKRDIERMFAPAVIRQAYRQIDMAAASPGLAEVALLDRMIDLIVEREARYDLIVFDTAPTGHTVQLLRMPEVMDTWIRALVKHRRALLEIDRGSERQDDRAGSRPGGSRAGGARAAAAAVEAAARPRLRSRQHVVRAGHDPGAARDRGNRPRRGAALRHRDGRRRADRQPRAARRAGGGVLPLAQGAGSAVSAGDRAGASRASAGPMSGSSRTTSTASRR